MEHSAPVSPNPIEGWNTKQIENLLRFLFIGSLEKKYLKHSMEHRNPVSPNMIIGWSTKYIEYVWSMLL